MKLQFQLTEAKIRILGMVGMMVVAYIVIIVAFKLSY